MVYLPYQLVGRISEPPPHFGPTLSGLSWSPHIFAESSFARFFVGSRNGGRMTHEHPWSEGAFAGGAEGGSNQISIQTMPFT